MENSLFTKLSTYKPRESVNPEENYSSELLAYILTFSLKRRTEMFALFASKLLGETVSIDNYADISVETQALFFTSTNNKAFPDLTIKTKDRCLLIEVKVESGLNYYEVDGENNSKETINQIRKYQGIEVAPKSIYLLTKYPNDLLFNDCRDFRTKFKWHDIHSLLTGYSTDDTVERYLVDEIIGYMEDKKMSIPKVTFEFAKGMDMLGNLIQQIETVLEGRAYQKSYGYEWMGYYIIMKNAKGGDDEKMGWIGNYYEGSRLIFEHLNQGVIDYIKKNNLPSFEMSKNHMNSYFVFEERQYFCLSAVDQVDILKKWIDENCALLEKYAG